VQKKEENAILIVLFLGVLMGALDIAIIAPAFTKIQSAFHLSMRHLVWIFSIYVLFNLICTPLMAGLSDQYGRKKIFLIGIYIFALGSLIVAISWNFSVVIIGRALQGVGSGGIFPIATAIIGDLFSEERRGRALGFLGSVYGVAFIAGPIIGGLLLMIDWHLIFLVNLFVAAYVIWQAQRLLPSKILFPYTFRFDWLGTILLVAILGSFSWGLNHIDTAHFYSSLTSVWIWPFLIGPVVLLPLLVLIEYRALAPIIPVRLFKIPQVTLGQLISLGAGELTSSMVLIPVFAIAAFNVSAFVASVMLIPAVLSISFGALLIGRFVDVYGPKMVVVGGVVCIIISTEALGFTGTTWPGFFLSIMALAFVIPALIGAPLRYIMLEEAPPQQRSAAQGMTSTIIAIGQLFGSAFLGTVATSHGGGVYGYKMVYIVQGLLMIIILIFALMLKNKGGITGDKTDNPAH
jgi:MFS family permease